MVVAKLPKEPGDFGRRVIRAMTEEGWTHNALARKAGMTGGYLSKLVYGALGGTSINPVHMRALSSVLHVNFEWLVLGTGPMRRDGRGSTPAEQAIVFARAQGAREDAISSAWERNRDREAEMTATDWVIAIDAEARRLDRAGVPRPEQTAAHQDAIKRTKKQLATIAKQAAKGGAVEESKPVGPVRRRASGL